MIKGIQKTFLIISAILFLFSAAYAENAFERELVVKDQTRKTKVESVFKKLIQAYEDESASDFLDLVSDDRFRQDYITFTDALYSDIRKYDIHEVEYWVEKVVSDNVKQFLYVKWEKRFENIDDGRQGNQKGYSRFLFDEVNGKYLLVELAGNTLFGGSLREWRDETPKISGEVKVAASTPVTADCANSSLGACVETNCASVGGYWYNGQCNSQPQETTPVCDSNNLTLCDAGNCASTGGGFWENGACYTNAEIACTSNSGYWYDNRCNEDPKQPDLMFSKTETTLENISSGISAFNYKILNIGNAVSGPCVIQINHRALTGAPLTPITIDDIGTIAAGGEYTFYRELIDSFLTSAVIIPDSTFLESDESNNEWSP